jgi:hypothetical protein
MKSRWSQVLAGVFAAVFIACLAHIMYLDSDYADRLPRSPDAVAKRVRPMTIHGGAHVFASDDEVERFEKAERRLFVSGFAAMIVVGWHNTRRRSTKE